MSWFFITMIAPFIYAMTNHIDKILIEKYFKESGVGTLMLFSSLISIVMLPFLFFLDTSVFSVGLENIFYLTIMGISFALVIWFYLLALADEEATVAIVFYQLVPVIALVLGYFVLDEQISQVQLIAMGIVLLGTTIISFDIDAENNFTLRKKTAIYMTLASFFWAVGSVFFKLVALEESVVRTLFWEHLVLAIVGILIYVFIRSYRESFITALRINSFKILKLNILNEGLYISANALFAFAFLWAPIALILLLNSFQPIFVLLIGVFLTVFFPNLSVEKIHKVNIMQKIIAIIITGIGSYILLM